MKLSLPSKARKKPVRLEIALRSSYIVNRGGWWYVTAMVNSLTNSKRRSRRYLTTNGKWVPKSELHRAACFSMHYRATAFMKRMLHPSAIQVTGVPVLESRDPESPITREHEKELTNGYAESL